MAEPYFSGGDSPRTRSTGRKRTKRRSTYPKRGTPEYLKQKQREIARAPDPSLKERAARIFQKTATPVNLAFKVLDVGRKPNQKKLFNKTTEEITRTGLSQRDAKNTLQKIAIGRGIKPNRKGFDTSDAQRFILDLVTSPTNLISGGTFGVGKQAAKTVVAKTAARVAAERAVAKGLAPEAAKKVGTEFAQKLTTRGVAPAAGKGAKNVGLTHSQMLRRAAKDPEIYKAIPKHARGGLGIANPITGRRVATLIPGKVTTRITAPLSRATQPVFDKTIGAFTPGHKAWRSGYAGAVARLEGKKSTQLARSRAIRAMTAIETAKRAFKKNNEEFEQVYKGVKAPAKRKQAERAEEIHMVLDDLHAEAKAKGIDLGYVDKYLPFVLSREAREKAGKTLPSIYPAGSKSAANLPRRLTKGYDPSLTREAVEKQIKEEHPEFREVDQIFSDDVFENLKNYSRIMSAKIESKEGFDRLRGMGILKETLDETKAGLKVDSVKEAGFAKADEAIFAAAHNRQDPRLITMKRQNPEEFDKLLRVAADKVREAGEASGRAAQKELKSLKYQDVKLERVSKRIQEVQSLAPKPKAVPVSLRRAIDRDRQKLTALKVAEPADLSELKKIKQRLKNNLRKANAIHSTSLKASEKEVKSRQQRRLKELFKQAEEAQTTVYQKRERASMMAKGIDPNTGSPWPLKTDAIPGGLGAQGFKQHEWAKIQGSPLPWFNGKQAPVHFADEILHNMSNRHQLEEFVKGFEKVQDIWRRGVTVHFPAFHVTNALGAHFNNWIGGVRTRHYVLGERILKGEGGKHKYRQFGGLSGEEIRNAAESLGFGSKGAITDVTEFTGGLRAGKGLTGAKSKLNPLSWGPKTAEAIENRVRMAAFLRGLENFKGDIDGAAEFVFYRHGDYSDLTGAERTVRKFVPFYKWARTNVPFQIQQMLEQPGYYQKFARLREQLKDPENQDPYENPPSEFEEEGLAIPLPGTGYKWYPRLPVTDVNEWGQLAINPVEGARKALSQTFAGGIVSGATKTNLWTGKHSSDPERDFVFPTPTQKKFLQPLRKIDAFKSAFFITKGGEWKVDPTFIQFIMTMNPAARVGSTEKQIFGEPGRDKPPKAQRIAAIGGVRISKTRPELARYSASKKLEELEKYIPRELRPRRQIYVDNWEGPNAKKKKRTRRTTRRPQSNTGSYFTG